MPRSVLQSRCLRKMFNSGCIQWNRIKAVLQGLCYRLYSSGSLKGLFVKTVVGGGTCRILVQFLVEISVLNIASE